MKLYSTEDTLVHYGVMGMKWGVRKDRNQPLKRLSRASKNHKIRKLNGRIQREKNKVRALKKHVSSTSVKEYLSSNEFKTMAKDTALQMGKMALKTAAMSGATALGAATLGINVATVTTVLNNIDAAANFAKDVGAMGGIEQYIDSKASEYVSKHERDLDSYVNSKAEAYVKQNADRLVGDYVNEKLSDGKVIDAAIDKFVETNPLFKKNNP